RDCDHRLGRCLEQDIVDDRLVLIRDVCDRAGQRVDDVEVWRREQLGLPLFQPLPRRRALALRAMPVAAAVVRDDRVRAALAARDMAAERDGAAALAKLWRMQRRRLLDAGRGSRLVKQTIELPGRHRLSWLSARGKPRLLLR